MVSGKVAPQVRELIKLASLEAERAAECIREAKTRIGFNGTTRDDIVVDLIDAGASLLKAHSGISCAHRALTNKITGK